MIYWGKSSPHFVSVNNYPQPDHGILTQRIPLSYGVDRYYPHSTIISYPHSFHHDPPDGITEDIPNIQQELTPRNKVSILGERLLIVRIIWRILQLLQAVP